MESIFVCPHCNKQFKLTLNEDAIIIEGVSFNIQPDEIIQKIRSSGYEFGEKGGE